MREAEQLPILFPTFGETFACLAGFFLTIHGLFGDFLQKLVVSKTNNNPGIDLPNIEVLIDDTCVHDYEPPKTNGWNHQTRCFVCLDESPFPFRGGIFT